MKNKIIPGIIIINIGLFITFLITRYYHPALILIHLLSLATLWVMVLKQLRLMEIIKNKWKEIVCIVLLILTAFLVRMYRVEEITPGMYGDEVMVANWGVSALANPEWSPFGGDLAHTTPLMYMTGMSMEALGTTPTSIRMPSIIFGALSVGAFYILLRLFFPIPISIIGSILMLFQYTHIVLSRLAYEPIPSLFFQIVAVIFFVLYYRTKKQWMLIGIALALGGGFYTYLNFRIFALAIFGLTIFLILRKHLWKQWREAVLFSALVFVSAMPFFNYSFINPSGFWGRSDEISIFGRNYSSTEFTKELWGNMHRSAILPFFQIPNPAPDSPPVSGDPNPGKNPAAAPVFDIATIILAIIGFIYLFRKKRLLFYVMVIMLLPPYLSDIFSTEVIPEGHYYGFGHPNALRVSGFIWVVLFATTASLYWLYTKMNKERYSLFLTFAIILISAISYWNWHLYFNQKTINPNFFIYNYAFNHGRSLLMVNYLNQQAGGKASISKDLTEDGYIKYFLKSPVNISSFELVSTTSAITTIKKNDITAIGVTEQSIPILNALDNNLKDGTFKNGEYALRILPNPFGQPNIVIFEKAGFTPSYSLPTLN